MGLHERNNCINFHKLLLLFGEVLVWLELLLNAITELFPIQVANQLFELVFIYDKVTPKSVHIQLNETVVSEVARQVKCRPFSVLYM
jgi:hypothetical protein